jgi:hypothetical protein
VSNVLITGAGSPNVFANTAAPGAAAGQYTLSGFGSGAYTVTPTKTTGQNSISSFDAALIAQHVAGIILLNANQLIVADVSANGVVSSFDAAMIAKYVAGPPFTSPGIGATSTWKFSPANKNYASVTASVTGEDYTAYLMGEVSGNWTNTGARSVADRHAAAGSGPVKSITVDLPRIMTSPNKEIVTPVSVQGTADKGIISYEFDLKYDPSVIQPLADRVDLTATASRGLSVVTNTTQPGLLRVVVYGPTPLDGNGVLLNLKFIAVGAPGSVSPLVFDRIMFNEGGPQVSTTDGQIELF